VYDFPSEYHGKGPSTPEMWQADITDTLRGSDDYCWAYSERFEWYGNDLSGKPPVPSEWLDATAAGRTAGQVAP
jgi:hypothetical protein